MNQINDLPTTILFASAENLDMKDESIDFKIARLGKLELVPMSNGNASSMKILNQLTIEAAGAVKTRRVVKYKEKDAIAALKFLELTLLYGFFENQTLELSKEGMETGPGFLGSRDKLAEKTLGSAQKIWSQLGSKKALRKSLKIEVKQLQDRMHKVMTRRLQLSEFAFFEKHVTAAIDILKAYINQK